MTVKIHYFGHSSLCVEGDDEAIFFHPNFSPRNLFFKRRVLHLPPKRLLDKVRAIVLSSGHYDHCDLYSFTYFPSKTAILVPKGLGKFLSKHLPNPIIELYNTCDTPFSTFHIQGRMVARDLPFLRPFRGCEQLNYTLTLENKRMTFLFHDPRELPAEVWRQPKSDLLCLFLNESPWRILLRSPGTLPAYITRFLSQPEAGEIMVPIGWGGYSQSEDLSSAACDAWKAFVSAQPDSIQRATQLIPIGESLVLS